MLFLDGDRRRCNGDRVGEHGRGTVRDQRRLENNQLACGNRLANLPTVAFEGLREALGDQPYAGETVPARHDHDRVQPDRFQPRREQQRRIETGRQAIAQNRPDATDLLSNRFETRRWIGVGQRFGPDRRPERRSKQVGPIWIAGLVSIEGGRLAGIPQNRRRGLQQSRQRRVVGRHEGRQQLAHRRQAAPFVACQNAYVVGYFRESHPLMAQREGQDATF